MTRAGTTGRLRGAFSLLGFLIAVVAAFTMHEGDRALYATYFVIAFAFEFVWLGSRFPFALPYYTAMNAFAYIAGPAVVTLEYAQRLVSYPLLAWLGRRGWMSLPPPLVPILQREATPASRLQALIDHGTAGTLGALSVLLRWGSFTVLRSVFDVGLVPALAIGEYGTLAALGVLHAFFPLPMREELRLGGRWRWRLDDERIDLTVVVVLVAPLFVFVINLAWALEGLPAAAGFTLATLGPHVLMKLSNDRLQRASALLESKQKELKELISTLAHDLKSPISSALLTTDVVLERDGRRLDDEAREDLGRVVRLLSRSEDMVRDLLRVFRIVWEPEQWDDVDLGPVARRVLESVGPQAAARGVTVTVAPLPTVWGQERKLEHALANLLDNAVRHAAEGCGRVALEAEVVDGAATLCVRDDGCGIPPDYRERIFELYARVPRTGDVAGSGVGLAIVKRVVEEHGGRVWVESEPGAGSAFYVRLPYVVTPPQPSATLSPAASAGASTAIAPDTAAPPPRTQG